MNRRDIGLGFIVVIIWGLNFIAIKLGLGDMPPLLLAAVRFVIVCVPAIFFLPRPQVKWRWLIALGLTLYAGQFAFLFLGIYLGMPTGLSSLVHQSQAFFTLLIAVMFIKERFNWNNLLGLIIAAIGMVIIGLQQGSSMTAVGLWVTLIGSVSWGAGNVIMRHATQESPPFSMLALVVWATAVAILPLGVLSLIIEGIGAWKAAWNSIGWVSIGSVFFQAYFASLCSYVLWGKLLSRYTAATVAPFALLVPVVGMSSAVIFLGESFSKWQLVGALFVMAGLVVNVFGGKWLKTETDKCYES